MEKLAIEVCQYNILKSSLWTASDMFNFSGNRAFYPIAGKQPPTAGDGRKPQWKVI